MYKCVHVQTGEPVLILDSGWRQRIDELRQLDRLDRLVCQGCLQPVRVRAGRQRRWHFAHKHLANCRFDQVSPALLAARAALYVWLGGQPGFENVDVEAAFPELDLPRPFDLLVNNREGRFAFWLIENRLHPAVREQLHRAFARCGFQVQVVFLSKMLHRDESKPNRFFLTTTERAFARETPFDSLFQALERPVGVSLQYIDPTGEELVTLRDLHCAHAPQVYAGRFHQNPLKEITVHPQNGGLSHPGELEKLAKLDRVRDRRTAAIARSRQSLGRIIDKILPVTGQQPGERVLSPAGQERARSSVPRADTLMQERAVCQFCGQETEDWWYLDKKTGLCKCRECLSRGLS